MQAPTRLQSLSTSWSAAFITRLHRYKSLLLRRWWIPALTVCLGLFVEAFLIYQTPPQYQSTSKDSNVFLRDYNQNRVSIDGTYSF